MRDMAKARSDHPKPASKGDIVFTKEPIGWLLIYSTVVYEVVSQEEELDDVSGALVNLESGFAVLSGSGLPRGFPLPLSSTLPTKKVFTTDLEKKIFRKARKSYVERIFGASPVFFGKSFYSSPRDGVISPYEGLGKRVLTKSDLYSPARSDGRDLSGIEFKYDISPGYLGLLIEEEEVEEFFSEAIFPGDGKWWLNKVKSLLEGEDDWILSVSEANSGLRGVRGTSLIREFLGRDQPHETNEVFENIQVISSSLGKEFGTLNPTRESLFLFRSPEGRLRMITGSYGKGFLFFLGEEYKFFALFPKETNRNEVRERLLRIASGLDEASPIKEFKKFLLSAESLWDAAPPLLIGFAVPIEGILARVPTSASSPLTPLTENSLSGVSVLKTIGVLPEGWRVDKIGDQELLPSFESKWETKSVPFPVQGRDGVLAVSYLDWGKPLSSVRWNIPGKALRSLINFPNSEQKRLLALLLFLQEKMCALGRKVQIGDLFPQELGQTIDGTLRGLLTRGSPPLDLSSAGKKLPLYRIAVGYPSVHGEGRGGNVDPYGVRDPSFLAEIGGSGYRISSSQAGEDIFLPGDRVYLALVRL